MAREETHVLISFCFGKFFPKLLTFREAMVMAFLFIGRRFQGGNVIDRSLCQDFLLGVAFALVCLRVLSNGGGAGGDRV
jgi:hypothetical protein